jgi:hypothetical protein
MLSAVPELFLCKMCRDQSMQVARNRPPSPSLTPSTWTTDWPATCHKLLCVAYPSSSRCYSPPDTRLVEDRLSGLTHRGHGGHGGHPADNRISCSPTSYGLTAHCRITIPAVAHCRLFESLAASLSFPGYLAPCWGRFFVCTPAMGLGTAGNRDWQAICSAIKQLEGARAPLSPKMRTGHVSRSRPSRWRGRQHRVPCSGQFYLPADSPPCSPHNTI